MLQIENKIPASMCLLSGVREKFQEMKLQVAKGE